MKRLFSPAVLALVIGAAALTAAAHSTDAAVHGGSSHASALSGYAVTLFNFKNGSSATSNAGSNRTNSIPVTGGVLFDIPSDRSGSSTFMAAVTVGGMQPHGTYDVRMVDDSCSHALYAHSAQLATVASGSDGTGMAIVRVTTRALFGGSFAVAVYQHNGNPASAGTNAGSTKGATPLTCGDVHKPQLVVPIKGSGNNKAHGEAVLSEPVALSLPVSGSNASDLVTAGTSVALFMRDLQQNAIAPAQVHYGECGDHGGIAYPLDTLVTDKHGRAVSTTAIPDLVPLQGLSTAVYGTDDKIEACGDLSPGSAH